MLIRQVLKPEMLNAETIAALAFLFSGVSLEKVDPEIRQAMIDQVQFILDGLVSKGILGE